MSKQLLGSLTAHGGQHVNRPGFITHIAVAIAFAIGITACVASTPSGSAPSSSAAVESSSAVSSASASASSSAASEEAEGSLPPFACSLPIHLAATAARAQITDIRLGQHDAFDRVVFAFALGQPQVTLDTAIPPLTQDPSGLQVNVRGTNFLRLVLHGGRTQLSSGGTSYGGAVTQHPNFPKLVDLVSAGDFEAVATWYLGLNGAACVRAFTLSGPDRLVIDVQH